MDLFKEIIKQNYGNEAAKKYEQDREKLFELEAEKRKVLIKTSHKYLD
jgi:hypothetical protein